MKKLAAAVISASLSMWMSCAEADMPPTYQSLWAKTASDTDCKPSDYPDFILVTCESEMTLWYFTKPSHPAHPGVIKHALSQEPDGSWKTRVYGYPSGSNVAAFQAWFGQITDLDRQMREQIEQQRGEAK